MANYERRRKEFFRRSRTDALLLVSGDAARGIDSNTYYYTGLPLDRTTILVRKDGSASLLISEMNAGYARELSDFDIVPYAPGDYWRKLREFLRGLKTVGVSLQDLPASFHLRLCQAARGEKLIDVSEMIMAQRAVKDSGEIAAIRKACRLARKALAGITIKAGKTEKRLHDELNAALYGLGAEPAFRPIVLSGKYSAFPHGWSRACVVKRNDVVLVDWGARHGSYCCDMSRCFFIGRGIGDAEKTYEKLQDVANEIVRNLRPGRRVADIATLAERLLRDAGLPKMPHGIGHGVGLDVHECFSFTKTSRHILKENMVVAIEPAVYTPKFGLRYENTILVGKRPAIL